MSKRDDINKLYKATNTADLIKKISFWVSVFFSVLAMFVSGRFSEAVLYLQLLSIVCYFICDVVDNGSLLYRAERANRWFSVRNGFVESSDAGSDSEGYYNNSLSGSMERYGMNTLESNFFSKNISGRMIVRKLIPAIIEIVFFLFFVFFSVDKNILLIVVQALLSADVVEDFVMLLIYNSRMDALYEEGSRLLIDRKAGSNESHEILAYCVEYEAMKAHYKVRLDPQIYERLNPGLSEEWEKIGQKRNSGNGKSKRKRS